MLLTSILKLFNSWYLSCTFQANVGCLSDGPLALGTVCAVLLPLAGSSTSLTAINAALVASLSACVIACVMFSDTISLYFAFVQIHLNWDCLTSSFPCVRLLLLLTSCNVTHIKGKWHYLLLLAMSFTLNVQCNYESISLCKVLTLHTSVLCADGIIILLCMYIQLANPGMLDECL